MFPGNGSWQFHLEAGVFMSKLNPVFFSMPTKANLSERHASSVSAGIQSGGKQR